MSNRLGIFHAWGGGSLDHPLDVAFKETNAEKTANLLEHVRKNALAKGLAVNGKKTALMCVSAAKSFDARVEVKFNGQSVKGKDSLRILGVTLDRDSSFSTHVEGLAKRMRARTWALSKLKIKGMKEENGMRWFPYSLYTQATAGTVFVKCITCLLYTSPSPRDRQKSRMPSSA